MKSTTITQFFLVIRPLMHIVIIVLVYAGITYLREYTDLIPFVQLRIPIIDFSETMRFGLISAFLFVFLWFVFRVYELFRPTQQWFGAFFKTRCLRLVMSGFLAWIWFGYLFPSGISRFVVLVVAAVTLFVLSISDLIRRWLANMWWSHFVYRILVIWQDMHALQQIAEEFGDHDEYEVTCVLIDDIPQIMFDRQGSILVGPTDPEWLAYRSDKSRLQGKDLYQLAQGHFLEDTFGVPMTMGPLVVTAWRSSPLTDRRRVVKRGIDICWSLLGLLLLSPVFLVVAILITLDSPGPVLYIQQRVGRHKKLFRFVKFRTMWTHLSTGHAYGWSEAQDLYEQLIASDKNVRQGILPKIANDPRVTRLWRFLRKTSLDELPSLWSVLMWDMSLVGPRPHLPREVEQYTDRHQRLFSVKPWITWYAQLYGRDKVPFDEEAKLDLRYIQHWSVWLDIYVLFATIKVVFWGK